MTMYYYKFKVFYDEVEDFVRDVEILANDNFESFHKLLYDCLGLKGNEYASFAVCDRKWNKQKEITLTDMSDDEDAEVPEYAEEDAYSTRCRLPKYVMKDAVIKDFITDPHQNIMYEYDFMDPKIFYVELQKVLKTDSAEGFPRCTLSVKELPVKRTAADFPEPEADDGPDDPESDGYFDDEGGYDEEDFGSLNEYSEFS